MSAHSHIMEVYSMDKPDIIRACLRKAAVFHIGAKNGIIRNLKNCS